MGKEGSRITVWHLQLLQEAAAAEVKAVRHSTSSVEVQCQIYISTNDLNLNLYKLMSKSPIKGRVSHGPGEEQTHNHYIEKAKTYEQLYKSEKQRVSPKSLFSLE